MFKKQEEKNKVGRPKLADTELKRDSLFTVITMLIVAITLIIVGTSQFLNMTGYTTKRLSGNVYDTNKLKGKASNPCKGKWTLEKEGTYVCNKEGKVHRGNCSITCPNENWKNLGAKINGTKCTARCEYLHPAKYLTCGKLKNNKATCTVYNWDLRGNTSSIGIDYLGGSGCTASSSKPDEIVVTCPKNACNKKGYITPFFIENNNKHSYTISIKKCTTEANKCEMNPKKITNNSAEFTYTCSQKCKQVTGESIKPSDGVKIKKECSGKTTKVTVTGLKPGKTYTLNYKLDGEDAKEKKFTTDSTTTKPANTAKSATAAQKNSCEYLKDKKEVTDTTAKLVYKCSSKCKAVSDEKIKPSKNGNTSIKIASKCGTDKKTLTITVSKLKPNTEYKLNYKLDGEVASEKTIKTKKKAEKATTKKTATTQKPITCALSIIDRAPKKAKYQLKCNGKVSINEDPKITVISNQNADKNATDGKSPKAKKPEKNNKETLKGNLTGLNPNIRYELKVKASNGKTYTKKFYVLNTDYLKKIKNYQCPIGVNITGIDSNGSDLCGGSNKTKCVTTKIKYVVNTAGLSDEQIENLYLVRKSYSESDVKYSYFDKKANQRKNDSEKIGDWNANYAIKVNTAFKKDTQGNYYKTITTDKYHYTALYVGKNKCYINYVVKDGETLNNTDRKYYLARYNIATKDGVVRGANNPTVSKPSDSKVFKFKGLKTDSCKATSQDAKSGNENSKTSKITMSKNNITGTFSLKLPNKYFSTGYLQNPLYTESKGISKAIDKEQLSGGPKYYQTSTKDIKGNKSWGLEIEKKDTKTKVKAGDNVYAMDAGTIVYIKEFDKDQGWAIQIKSTVGGKDYRHTYARLKKPDTNRFQVGDRVYKGQYIGKTKGTKLFVSLIIKTGDGKDYVGVAANNFIGRNLSYGNIPEPKNASDKKVVETFRAYIKDNKLAKLNTFCNGDTGNGDSKVTTTTTTKNTDPNRIPVAGIKLDKTTLTRKVGETYTFVVSIVPTNATDKTVKWTSSDSNVVSVNDTGVITANKVGTATITATTNDGEYAAQCVVTVVDGSSAGTCKVGDANCNGEVRADDALRILRHAVNKEKLTISNPYEIADVLEKYDEIRTNDALEVLRFATGKTKKVCNKSGTCNTK